MLAAVILAAGLGKRMKSDLPKVLHKAARKPLIRWVADAARGAGASKLIAVIGPEMTDANKAEHLQGFETVVQHERLGTGHAAQQAVPLLKGVTEVLILCGDVPCIRTETLSALVDRRRKDNCAGAVLTMMLDDPAAYGRIVQQDGFVSAIVEARDATPEQLKIQEVNSGTYIFRTEDLIKGLGNLRNDNAQGEYYITDVVGECVKAGEKVASVIADDPAEMLGVNTPVELAVVERRLLSV